MTSILPSTLADPVTSSAEGEAAVAKARPDCLNRKDLASLARTQPRLLEKMFQLYVQHSPAMVARMREALAAKDRSSVRSAAHSLKSSSANCFALPLSSLCLELERAVMTAGNERLDELVKAIEAELAVVLPAIEAVLPTIVSPPKAPASAAG